MLKRAIEGTKLSYDLKKAANNSLRGSEKRIKKSLKYNLKKIIKHFAKKTKKYEISTYSRS